MGGRNNQPKVSQSDGIYLGEAARRVITMGDELYSIDPTRQRGTQFILWGDRGLFPQVAAVLL